MIASRAVKQPAVFGSTSTPGGVEHVEDRAARGRIQPAQRHRAQLACPDAFRACASISWLVKPPVPRIRRELKLAAGDRKRIGHVADHPP